MRRWAAPLLLAAAVLAALVALEAKTPFYFLQDDNRAQNLPFFVHAYEALAQGRIALFNFHQYLGTPFLATGQASVLYPPMYLSLALSQLFLGHLQGGVDVLVVLHLLLAALGMYWVARLLGLSEEPAFLAGLSWPLCSFVMYVGNSWVPYTAFAAWFPFMLAGALLLLRRPGPAPLALLVAARTLLFLDGHPQNFLYATIFEVLVVGLATLADAGVLAARRGIRFPGVAPAAAGVQAASRVPRFLPRYLLSFVLTFAASAPLLFPMLAQTAASAGRSDALPLNVYLSGIAKAAELLRGFADPYGDGLSLNNGRYYSFIGRPLVLLAAFGVAAVGLFLLARTWRRPDGMVLAAGDAANRTLRRVLLVAGPTAALAWFWATDTEFLTFLYGVPILNRFRWPFKLTIFLSFFLILLGAMGLQVLKNRLLPEAPAGGAFVSARRHRERTVAAAIVLVGAIVLQYGDLARLYLAYPLKTMKIQTEAVPLTEPYAATIGQERVVAMGFRADIGDTGKTIAYDYASLFGLYYFAGYDPLVSKANSEATMGLNYDAVLCRGLGPTAQIPNTQRLRAYGVRWYVAPAGTPDKDLAEMVPVASDGMRTLYRDDRAAPMAFAEEGARASADGVALEIGVNGLTVRTDRAEASRIVVAFLRNPAFSISVDGRTAAFAADAYDRVAFDVPAGAHVVRIAYRDAPFELGLAVAGAAALATLGAWLLSRRLRRLRAAKKAVPPPAMPGGGEARPSGDGAASE